MAAVGVGQFVKRNFPVYNLTRKDGDEKVDYDIAGPLCTPNDLIGQKVSLPETHVGDLIAVASSGAYGLTASPSLFLSRGAPCEVLLHESEAYLIRRRQEWKDILCTQSIPEILSL